MEIWKIITDFNNYSISNHGYVKNNKTNIILKLRITGDYYRIGLTKNGKVHMLYPHELVAKYFIDNPDNKILIHHLDNNTLNNNVNNLVYYNIEENLYNCLEGEIFRKVIGYDNYYISNLGRVKSDYFNREHLITLIKIKNRSKHGYYYFNANINKKLKKKLFPHRLVAEHFIDNPDNKPQVDHINRISTDNRVSNLRWTTQRENNYNLSMLNTNTSGFIGVHKDKKTNKWVAGIRINGKKTFLGSFINIEDAANAYQEAKNEYHIIN